MWHLGSKFGGKVQKTLDLCINKGLALEKACPNGVLTQIWVKRWVRVGDALSTLASEKCQNRKKEDFAFPLFHPCILTLPSIFAFQSKKHNQFGREVLKVPNKCFAVD